MSHYPVHYWLWLLHHYWKSCLVHIANNFPHLLNIHVCCLCIIIFIFHLLLFPYYHISYFFHHNLFGYSICYSGHSVSLFYLNHHQNIFHFFYIISTSFFIIFVLLFYSIMDFLSWIIVNSLSPFTIYPSA